MSQKVNARNSYCDKGHLPPKPLFTLAFMLVHLSGTGEFWHISPVLLDCRSCSSPHPRRWVSILPETKMGQESWCAEIHLEKNPAFKVRRKTFDQQTPRTCTNLPSHHAFPLHCLRRHLFLRSSRHGLGWPKHVQSIIANPQGAIVIWFSEVQQLHSHLQLPFTPESPQTVETWWLRPMHHGPSLKGG